MSGKSRFSVVYAKVFVSIAILGSSGVLIKLADLPSGTLSFLRMGIPALLIFTYLKAHKIVIFRTSVKLMLLGSALNAVRVFLYIYSFNYTSIAKAVMILYTWPISANIFSILFLGEQVPRRNLYLLSLPMVGVSLLFIDQPFSLDNEDFLGMSAMLLSATIYAITVIIFKRKADEYTGPEITFYQCFIGAVVFLPLFVLERANATLWQMGIGASYAVLVGVVAFGLYFSTLRHIKASTLSFLSYLEVVVAICFGVAVFDDTLSWNIISGGCLIVASTLLIKKN